jgi:hypothetical protein
MKIQEFIEKFKKMNSTQTVKKLISTKSYLSFNDKQALVDKVVNACMEVNNGYIQFDEVKKYIVFTIEIIKAYTEIEFDDNFDIAITEYDALCEVDALNSIVETFEGEYKTVLNMINMRQDYILKSNSIECQIVQFLSNLNNKLDTTMESISNQFGSFKDLNITADDISKLTDLIGTLGK